MREWIKELKALAQMEIDEDLKNDIDDHNPEPLIILKLIADLERLEFELQCEKDAYGSDVFNILGAVQDGTMSKMAAHQRLNKVYKERYVDLENIKEKVKAIDFDFVLCFIGQNHNDSELMENIVKIKALQQAIAESEEKP